MNIALNAQDQDGSVPACCMDKRGLARFLGRFELLYGSFPDYFVR